MTALTVVLYYFALLAIGMTAQCRAIPIEFLILPMIPILIMSGEYAGTSRPEIFTLAGTFVIKAYLINFFMYP